MPHVLAMERAGETFSNYFVTDSLCCPSRASILTGRFPHDTRVFDNSPPEGGYSTFSERGEQRETFAVALQRAGLQHGADGQVPQRLQPDAARRRRSVPPGLERVGRRRRRLSRVRLPDEQRRACAPLRPQRARIPDERARAQGARHSSIARRPRSGRSCSSSRRSRRTRRTRRRRATAASSPGCARRARRRSTRSASTSRPGCAVLRRSARARRDDRCQVPKRAQAVQAVDRMIGSIERELAAKGLARDTYIVFSSDNGLHMGEHRLRPGKLTAFDTDIKVPLIVTGPGVPAGRTVSAMTENVDLCPSFEQLAGAPAPASVDGHSLVSLWHGHRARGWRKEILVEHHGRVQDRGDPDLPPQGSGNPPSYEAIRTRDSLYVEYVTGEREYYDLARDPFELDNVAAQLPPRASAPASTARSRGSRRATARARAGAHSTARRDGTSAAQGDGIGTAPRDGIGSRDERATRHDRLSRRRRRLRRARRRQALGDHQGAVDVLAAARARRARARRFARRAGVRLRARRPRVRVRRRGARDEVGHRPAGTRTAGRRPLRRRRLRHGRGDPQRPLLRRRAAARRQRVLRDGLLGLVSRAGARRLAASRAGVARASTPAARGAEASRLRSAGSSRSARSSSPARPSAPCPSTARRSSASSCAPATRS